MTNHTNININLNTGGDAFSYSEEEEVARIIHVVACFINGGKDSGVCIDINGNRVGEWAKD